MATYEVEVSYNLQTTITVEADSEEEACEKATERFADDIECEIEASDIQVLGTACVEGDEESEEEEQPQ